MQVKPSPAGGRNAESGVRVFELVFMIGNRTPVFLRVSEHVTVGEIKKRLTSDAKLGLPRDISKLQILFKGRFVETHVGGIPLAVASVPGMSMRTPNMLFVIDGARNRAHEFVVEVEGSRYRLSCSTDQRVCESWSFRQVFLVQ